MTPFLSPHFSYEEMTQSQTATRKGLDNTPPPDALNHLHDLCAQLERVRSELGAPMLISSGYRAPAVNAAVGGAEHSAHMLGWAADFIAPDVGSPLTICHILAASDLPFDQLLEEGTWVHISFDPRARREVMTKKADGSLAPGLRSARGMSM